MSNPNKTAFSQLIVLIKLAVPIILGNIAYAILSFTDILMAGMAGTPDQAGVAIGGSFFFPTITFIVGMVSGLHPVISRHCGAQTRERIPQDHAHAIVSCLIVGIIGMVALLVIALFFLHMDTSERMEHVTRYYVVAIAFCLPVAAFFSSSRAFCEAMGNTKATLYFGLLAIVLNIPLNYVLIFGKLGLPAFGGIGCGIATFGSMFISMLVILVYISVVPALKPYSFLKNKDGITVQGVKDFCKLSLPLGISAAVECSCFTIIALLLSPLGPTAVSANTVAMTITSCVYNFPLSMGIATSIMVGYAIGQNNLKTLRCNIKAAYLAAVLCIFIDISLLLLAQGYLPPLFSDDIAVSSLAALLLLFACCNQVFECLQTLQAFILRGFKDTKIILVTTFVAFYCVALVVGASLCYELIPTQGLLAGPKGFWLGLGTGLFTAAFMYRKHVLKHYKAVKEAAERQDSCLNATA